MAFTLATALCSAAVAAPSSVTDSAADRDALTAAVSATCGRDIVLLGEASHGDGHGDAFKVALVERLVSECRFDTVLFEASFYEFSPIATARAQGRAVSADMIATAVGALWKFDREVQPLFDFLAARVDDGTVDVGGLDFQAGGFQQPYGNDRMIGALVAGLPSARAAVCQAIHRSRVYDDDPPTGMTEASRDAALSACLVEAAASLATPATRAASSARLEAAELDRRRREVANLQGWLAAAGGDAAALVRARDSGMADNLAWTLTQSRRPSPRVIVWTHNGHAAKDARSLTDYHGGDNLGAALARRYGSRVFALGLTACGGTYRWSRGSDRPIAPPPGDSLEAAFCRAVPEGSRFVSADVLRAGARPMSGLMGHEYRTGNWADAFDGIVFLDREHPPQDTMK